MNRINEKVYLGDSVYAMFDGGMLWLTTENGLGPSNRIALEPEVWRALENFVRNLPDIQPALTPTVCANCFVFFSGGGVGERLPCRNGTGTACRSEDF